MVAITEHSDSTEGSGAVVLLESPSNQLLEVNSALTGLSDTQMEASGPAAAPTGPNVNMHFSREVHNTIVQAPSVNLEPILKLGLD